MDPATAARRWADTWSRAWPQRDVEAIAALYADGAVYRSPAFRPPDLGLAGVRRTVLPRSAGEFPQTLSDAWLVSTNKCSKDSATDFLNPVSSVANSDQLTQPSPTALESRGNPNKLARIPR